MNSIKDLKPTAIWQNFYKLTQVPRPSNHEEQARKFMLEWAKENNIEAEIDEVGNIMSLREIQSTCRLIFTR